MELITIRAVDPFDLPEWVGTAQVTFEAQGDLVKAPRVPGRLVSTEGEEQLDLLAVDCAYPAPVCSEEERRAAHQAWQLGEIALLTVSGRTVCAVPGTRFTADLVVEVLRRVAKAFGAPPRNFKVSIQL